jgi:glycosyltransferase involved in cell wall biosynthesis
MARILFDARAIAEPSGGVTRVAERLLAHLRSVRSDDEITTITTGFIDPRVSTSGVQNLHLRLPNKLWSLACLFGVTSLDVAATKKSNQTYDELILPNVGFVGVPNIPYTIVVHDLSFLIEPTWFPWKMQLWHHAVRASRLIKSAQHVWCVSEATKRDVMRLLNVDEKKIDVIPPDIMIGPHGLGVGAGFPRPEPERGDLIPIHRYILAFDGSPRKNVATIDVAMERLRRDDKFHDVELIVIGRDRHPTDAELADLYRHASALLYPSWYEGFGLPLHEAAAYNIPILASAHGALPETAQPGVIFINPAKPQLWEMALKSVLLS